MTTQTTRKMMVAAAAGLIAVMGAMGPAEAKKGGPGPGHHKVFKKLHWHKPYFFVTYGGGCHYYYWKWKRTGSPFWKFKYFECIY